MDTSTAATPASSSTDIQLPINLFTRNPSHTIPSSTYLLPSSWRRFQLSSLINKVLNPNAPIPFDFIVDGELLRGSLEAYVKNRRGGDMESTLHVEYVESLLPPKEQGTYPQDDWVSGVSIKRPGFILLSSYLSHAKIIPLTHPTSTTSDDAQPPSITLPLPTRLGSTCTSWLSPPPSHEAYDPSAPILVGAGGVDRQTHIFSIPSDRLVDLASHADPSAGCREIMTLHLHTGPVSSLSPSLDYSNVLTSSWDGLLGVFKLPTREEPLEERHEVGPEPGSYLTGVDRRSKKRRLNVKDTTAIETPNGEQANGLPAANSGGYRKSPEMVLRGHNGRIGGSIWDKEQAGTVWSAGWDGSVRGWDVESGGCEVVKQGPQERAALCIDQMAGTRSLVTGHMDRVVCLWDARESASVISLTLPTPAATPSVTAHPTSSFTLATASYSGHLQIWDVRSPKQALFSVKKQPRKDNKIVGGGTGERLLSVDWDGEVMIAGGEDGEVGVWSARGE